MTEHVHEHSHGAPDVPETGSGPRRSLISRAVSGFFVSLIRFYQRFISPLSGPTCRYYPTCSAYGVKALQVHGPIKGVILTGWRLLKCNPFTKGGVDPVPRRGYWRADVLPNGQPRPGREGFVGAPTAATGTEVVEASGIRHNETVGIASTSSDTAVPTSDAAPLDPATTAETVIDLGTDGPAHTGPRQEPA